jgi:hypothetical protein
MRAWHHSDASGCAVQHQNTGVAHRVPLLGPEENAAVGEGSVSGARFPGDRWKALIAPARSN